MHIFGSLTFDKSSSGFWFHNPPYPTSGMEGKNKKQTSREQTTNTANIRQQTQQLPPPPPGSLAFGESSSAENKRTVFFPVWITNSKQRINIFKKYIYIKNIKNKRTPAVTSIFGCFSFCQPWLEGDGVDVTAESRACWAGFAKRAARGRGTELNCTP